MEGIVDFEGEIDEDGLRNEICFSKLYSLELRSLPNMVSFCTKLGTPATTDSNATIHAQPLFNEKVIFPVLEILIIQELGNIVKIWDKQSIAIFEERGSFCQLTNVVVTDCNKLMHVFPSNMHPLLKNLQNLIVRECGTMKAIAEFEGEVDEDGLRNEVASPALEHLEMVGAPKITDIRNKQPLPESRKEVESLCKLKDIAIENCNQLMYVFPSNMLPQNLERLNIARCNELEVIFSKELKEKEAINNDIIMFPQLKYVTLETLPKLKSFYIETQSLFSHKVIFPVLENLYIYRLGNIVKIWDKQSIAIFEERGSFCQLTNVTVDNCNKLMHVFPSNMHPLLKNLQSLKVRGCGTMKAIAEFEGEVDEDGLRNEVASSALEYLEMVGALKIIDIRNKQPLPEFRKEVESLCKLGRIEITNCNQLMYVFPSNMLPQNLQELEIRKCNELEVIFSKDLKEKEAINNDIIVFPKLKYVKLWKLPKLKSFYTETQGLFSHKVVFPALKRLLLWQLDKLTWIWDNQPLSKPEKEAKSLCKLIKISVLECVHLEYVLPFYMLPQLKNLQQLYIRGCTKMEAIISNNPKEKEVTNSDTILLPQLKIVELGKLPTKTLLFLCNKDAFPALKKIWVHNEVSMEECGTSGNSVLE